MHPAFRGVRLGDAGLLARSLFLILLLALFGNPWGSARAQTIEPPRVVVAVGGKASFQYLPLLIAQSRGYFRDEGIQVEIIDVGGGTKALEALVGGSADVSCGGYEHTIQMQARGQSLRAFVLLAAQPQLAIVVAGAKAEMVKGPSDLKGMRIGVSAPGSLSNVVASLYLSQGGLKPSDVSFVGVGTGASALAALRSGQIDVLSSVDPAITILESRGEIKILADTRTRKGSIALLGGLPASASLYTTEPFLRQHPKSVQALANAIVRADRWLVHAPATEVFATLSESYPLGDRSIYLAAFEKLRETYSADGLFTEAGVKSALEFVLAADKDIDPTRIRLADTYTNEFVLRAPSGMP